MGSDKALLPHPEGGTWLERTLRLLAELGQPISLLSRHPRHLALARELAEQLAAAAPTPVAITAIAEPPPWEGPLLALHRLMQRHPDQRLLLCPVDMPGLSLETLQALLAAALEPGLFHLAHDGQRPQPLLGVYPTQAGPRRQLAAAIGRGERSLQRWLATQPCRMVALDPATLGNVNRPEELAVQSRSCTSTSRSRGPSSSTSSTA
jgi:molybdopterin-guanine dinucleotide biosynthesis protein A